MDETSLAQELGVLSDDSQGERMVFPLNIHESLAASGGLKASERKGIIMSFWLFASLLIGWFLASWLRTVIPQYYGWAVLGIEVVLQLTVGTFIVRFLMDEGTIIAEMENKDNSFAKYFGIYREHLADEWNTYPFDVIEFADGTYGVYIQLLLGYNTNQASSITYDLNREVQKMINKSGMVHRTIYSNERFLNSTAAEELRKVVASVRDPQLFKVYRDVVKGLLDIANEQSNVVCVTHIIFAKTRMQKEDLGRLVENILSLIGSEDSAYREASTMSYQDIVEFYRNYYKLDVLDMGLIRVHSAKKKGVSCPVNVLKVYGKSGKIYTTSAFGKLKTDMLKEDGLERVN